MVIADDCVIKRSRQQKSSMPDVMFVGRPFINIKKRMGPSTVPLGTQDKAGDHFKADPF